MTRKVARFFRQVADLIDPPSVDAFEDVRPAFSRPHPEVATADVDHKRFEEMQTIAKNITRLADAIGSARRHQPLELRH